MTIEDNESDNIRESFGFSIPFISNIKTFVNETNWHWFSV